MMRLHDEWMKLKADVIPANATDEQIADIRFAFYVGAMQALNFARAASREAMENGGEPESVRRAAMKLSAFHGEAVAYLLEVAAEARRKLDGGDDQ